MAAVVAVVVAVALAGCSDDDEPANHDPKEQHPVQVEVTPFHVGYDIAGGDGQFTFVGVLCLVGEPAYALREGGFGFVIFDDSTTFAVEVQDGTESWAGTGTLHFFPNGTNDPSKIVASVESGYYHPGNAYVEATPWNPAFEFTLTPSHYDSVEECRDIVPVFPH